MKAEYRAEYAEFKPSNHQLPEFFRLRIPIDEPADIRGPPGYPAHGHVKPCLQLFSQAVKGGSNVPRPQYDSIPLGAQPCASDQVAHFLTLGFQAVVKCLCKPHAIDIADLLPVSKVHADIVVIIGPHLRLRLIQPEGTDSIVIVIFLSPGPEKFLGSRMGGIHISLGTKEHKYHVHSPLSPENVIMLSHICIIFTPWVYGRPDGHHQFDAHGLQLTDHGLGIRPFLRIKLPFSLHGPMKIINDYD